MNGSLFVAWRSGGANSGHWGPVGRLDHGDFGYRFVYTRGAQTLVDFAPFPGMPELDAVYESDALFPMFANRLLGSRRPEYEAFLRWSDFAPDSSPDPISILAVTEGRRATDSFEVFPCPIPDEKGYYVGKFFVHGIRWMDSKAIDRIPRLNAGESLNIVREDSNLIDPNAVAVYTNDDLEPLKIGYVPRYLARDVRSLWCEHSPDEYLGLAIARVNPDAPIQHRVLCRMNVRWPESFVPCSGEEFQPITAEYLTVT